MSKGKEKKPALSGSTVADRSTAPTDPLQPDLLDPVADDQVMIRNEKKTGNIFLPEKLGPGESIMVTAEFAWSMRIKFGIRLSIVVARDE